MLLRLMRTLGAVLVGLGMLAVPGTASADGALPADQVVFMVDSGGGLVPPVVYALESPSLVIYGDGRVLSIVKDATGGAVPARYQLTRVDPLAVAAFVSSAEASGIINSDKDFGQPLVTDMDSTTVMVHGENAPAKVSVYAFHDQFDKDVTADQQKARAALRQLIDTASNLAAGATPVPYTPDSVVVYDVGLGYGDRAATTVWPGPPPASFLKPSNQSRSVACGQLSGAQATTVYNAALDNPGALWRVDGASRVLAVNPLPVAESCP
jgi:hypothetical protein